MVAYFSVNYKHRHFGTVFAGIENLAALVVRRIQIAHFGRVEQLEMTIAYTGSIPL